MKAPLYLDENFCDDAGVQWVPEDNDWVPQAAVCVVCEQRREDDGPGERWMKSGGYTRNHYVHRDCTEDACYVILD